MSVIRTLPVDGLVARGHDGGMSEPAESERGAAGSFFGYQQHEYLSELLAAPTAGVVVDLGAGRGATLRAVGRRVGPQARLIGVERGHVELPAGLATDERVSYVVADLNRQLPFDDGSADAAVCHNTLECLSRKAEFLRDVHRILKPGARFVLGHSDFDTFVFASSDLELTRSLVHAFCDTTQAWMETSDGTMGRKLTAVAAESPFELLEARAWVYANTDFNPGSPARLAADAIATIGRRHPNLADRVDRWLADLEELAARDSFLYSVNDYAVMLRK
jgi:SAM-dependent methyltransferase